MECPKIEEKLGLYGEGTLSPEEMTIVREHLASCPECTRDLAELQKTLRLLKDLDPVEPPPWLAQKIMAMVREEEKSREGLMAWLFRPLRLKVPLQAFALVMVVGIAVLLYRVNAPEYEFIKSAPLQQSESIRNPAPESAARKEREAPAQRDRIATVPPKEEDRVPPTSAPGPAGTGERPAMADKKDADPRFVAEKAPLPAPVAGALTAPTMKEERAQEFFQSDGEGKRSDIFRKKSSAIPRKGLGTPSEQVTVTVHTAHTPMAADVIEGYLKTLDSTNVVRQTRDNSLVIVAEVMTERLPDLFGKLRQDFSVMTPAVPETFLPHITLRIEIVSP
jgi:hypothetical protein